MLKKLKRYVHQKKHGHQTDYLLLAWHRGASSGVAQRLARIHSRSGRHCVETFKRLLWWEDRADKHSNRPTLSRMHKCYLRSSENLVLKRGRLICICLLVFTLKLPVPVFLFRDLLGNLISGQVLCTVILSVLYWIMNPKTLIILFSNHWKCNHMQRHKPEEKAMIIQLLLFCVHAEVLGCGAE